ncbi:uncharacterized protein J4E84_001647 [Alternaria hordeiaustralica]|uniref:uncharacterized protein n=1 Tax=Alternaria hordeiaustralica TaxID=1187925 RepID=UPI0020C562B4|nr:uncharacterized protein J4E84_001647 [Alternaria hordeiaustralica]KAI4695023.1 hypothetical protein J4E84_001647 [Alternaria hordeiaustralica]
MSEPSETGGLPLDLNTHQQQQPTGSTIHQPSPPRVDYRKTSQSSNDLPKASKAASPRRRPGTTKQAPSGPHTGSSRSEKQPGLSPTNMSSHNNIHYTRTGRISKAKKGLKVHNCENCGRSYTRAEHLRRHQKNHAQEDALICQVPGCGKTFVRVDLLQRHQERHNEPTRDSPEQSPEGSPEPTSMSLPALEQPMMEMTTNSASTSYYETVSPVQETAPFTSGYASPIASTDFSVFGNPSYRARTPSNASMMDPSWGYPSRSPASTTSTMAYPWGSSDKGSTAPNLAYMNACSFPMTNMSIPTSMDAMTGYGHFGPRTLVQRDEEEGVMLFGEEQYGMASIAHTQPFEQYLDYFWRLFHPTFPIVHRPTSLNPSPMLRAAMIAIGSQYSADSTDKKKGRDLHDRCLKLLEWRDLKGSTEPDRLCDFQAMFLIEVLSQYRARRAAKVLSSRFDKVYHKAVEDCRSTTSKAAELLASLDQLEQVTPEHWTSWVELATWQHLFLSCYILESQQPVLLAREALTSLIHDSRFDIPFPAHGSLWDATSPIEWAAAAQQYPYTPSYVDEVTSTSLPRPLDTFQSSVILAVHYSRHKISTQYMSSSTTSSLEHLLDDAPATKRMLSVAKLVQVTPIRALLAVACESWIFSEKVATAQGFAALKTTLRTWIAQLWCTSSTEGAPVKEALKLSIDILQQAVSEQRDRIPLEMGTDMSVFFAALVLWAITVAATTRTKTAHQKAGQQNRRPSNSESPPIFSPTTWASAPPTSSSTSTSTSQPHSPIISATPENPLLSHAQIIINTISFLTDTLAMSDTTASSHQHLADHARRQTGCISLLLWVKLRLRGVSLEDQSGAAADASGEGLGELLEGVVGSIETILKKGWGDWGF